MNRHLLVVAFGAWCVGPLAQAAEPVLFLSPVANVSAQEAMERSFLDATGAEVLVSFDEIGAGTVRGDEWADRGVTFKQPGGGGLALRKGTGLQRPYSPPNSLWPAHQGSANESIEIWLAPPRESVGFWLIDSEHQSGTDYIEFFTSGSGTAQPSSILRVDMPAARASQTPYFFVGLKSETLIGHVLIRESTADNDGVGVDQVWIGGGGANTPYRNLVVAGVTAPPEGAVGETIQVTWRVTNTGTSMGPTDWVESVHLSTDERWSIDDVFLLRAARTGAIPAGASASFTTGLRVPPVPEGRYRFLVQPVLSRGAASNDMEITWQALKLVLDGPAIASSFSAEARERYFTVSVSEGEDAEFILDDEDDQGTNELYLRHENLPSRAKYDSRSRPSSSADQSLRRGLLRGGNHYVLARSIVDPGAGPSGFTVRVKRTPLEILAVAPDRSTNSAWGIVSPAIRGTRFRPTSSVLLKRRGFADIAATRLFFEDTTNMAATFDLRNAPAGPWSIVVSNGAGEAASAPFLITQTGVPGFMARMVLPSALGYHRRATFWIEYSNVGEAPMTAPLLKLHGSRRALLTADPSLDGPGLRTEDPPAGLDDTVQVLAAGTGGDPGILNPGESGRIPVYYRGLTKPWDRSVRTIDFELAVLPPGSEIPIDWDEVEAEIRPSFVFPERWDPFFAELKSRTGDTWDDFASRLIENARVRSECGDPSVDARKLYHDEVDEIFAGGSSCIVGRVCLAGSGEPLPDIDIIASRETAAGVGVGRSDAQGNFTMRFLPTGSYRLDAEGWLLDPIAEIRVSEAHQVHRVELIAGQGAVLKGSVVSASTGLPIPLAKVSVKSPDTAMAALLVETGDGGEYSVAGLPSGKCVVSAWAEGHVRPSSVEVEAVLEKTIPVDFALEKGASISGTVQSTGGALLESALVTAIGETTIETAQTDPDGTFTVGGLPEGVYSLEVGAEGFVATTIEDRQVSAGEDVTGLVVSLRPAGSLSGIVTEIDGKAPIQGAVVKVRGNSGGSFVTESDAQGKFSFSSLDEGVHRLEVSALSRAGHVQMVEIPKGGAAPALEVRIGPGGSIDVRVLAADGVTPAAGTPVAAFRDGTPIGVELTDSSGRVSLEGLAPGNYVVLAFDKGTAYRPASISLKSTQRAALDLTAAAASLRGTVKSAATGAPIGGATVVAGIQPRDELSPGAMRTTTDSLGRYSFDHLLKGTYWVSVSAPGHGQSGAFVAAGIPPSAGLLDVSLPSSVEVQGVVRDASTGRAIPDAVVRVRSEISPEGDPGLGAKADSAGLYSIQGVAPGAYLLEAQANGFVPVTLRGVQIGSPSATVHVSLPPEGARIGGRLIDKESGLPVGMEGVILSGPFLARLAFTDSSGRFLFEDVPLGRWQIRPAGAASGDAVEAVVASLSDDLELELELQLVPRSAAHNPAAPSASSRLSKAARAASAGDELPEKEQFPPRCDNCLLDLWTDPARNEAEECMKARKEFQEMWNESRDLLVDRYLLDLQLEKIERLEDRLDAMDEAIYDMQWDLAWSGALFIGQTVFPIVEAVHVFELIKCLIRQPPICDPPDYIHCRPNYCMEELTSLVPIGHLAAFMNKYFELQRLHVWRERLAIQISQLIERYNAGVRKYEIDWYVFEDKLRNMADLCDHEGIETPARALESAEKESPESGDPNGKVGPLGYGSEGFISEPGWMPYTIYFENMPQATAAATEVRVVDALASCFDWDSVELLQLGFGSLHFSPPAGSSRWEESLEVPRWSWTAEKGWHTQALPLGMHLVADFDREAGTITWQFLASDPETGTWPEDPYSGFLPPEPAADSEAAGGAGSDGADDSSARAGSGQGYVTFRVKLKEGLPSGTRIENVANNYFDFNPPVPTPVARNVIDIAPPSSAVTTLAPLEGGRRLSLEWSGSDGDGSGIAFFEVYVREDKGSYTLWLRTQDSKATFEVGDPGHEYSFYSVAVDNIGNREAAPAAPDVTSRSQSPATTEPGGGGGGGGCGAVPSSSQGRPPDLPLMLAALALAWACLKARASVPRTIALEMPAREPSRESPFGSTERP